MKEILNFQKYFGVWSPEFRQGYQDFLRDKGCNSQHPEYLKGYEYSRQERIECRQTNLNHKSTKRCNEKIIRAKELLDKGLKQCEIAKALDISESYVYKIKNGFVR